MANKSLIVNLFICVVALLPFTSIASGATEAKTGHSLDGPSGEPSVSRMLEAIYASQRPVGFQQIDVTHQVSGSIPLGSTRAAILEAFRTVQSSRVVKATPETLVIRDDRGKAMLDPDARSIIMTYSFDIAGKLRGVNAVYLFQQ